MASDTPRAESDAERLASIKGWMDAYAKHVRSSTLANIEADKPGGWVGDTAFLMRLLSERDAALAEQEAEIGRLREENNRLVIDRCKAPYEDEHGEHSCEPPACRLRAPSADADASRSRRPGFDVGAGKVKEGDTAIFDGRECKVLTVYHDGDVQIEVPTYKTVRWRFVTPAPAEGPGAAADMQRDVNDRFMRDKLSPSADADALELARAWLIANDYWEPDAWGGPYTQAEEEAASLAAALVAERRAAEARAYERAAQAARGSVVDHSECGHGEGYIDGRLDAEAAIRALIKTPETAIWRDGYAAADGRADRLRNPSDDDVERVAESIVECHVAVHGVLWTSLDPIRQDWYRECARAALTAAADILARGK